MTTTTPALCAVSTCDVPAGGLWDVIARPTSYRSVPLCEAHRLDHLKDFSVVELRAVPAEA